MGFTRRSLFQSAAGLAATPAALPGPAWAQGAAQRPTTVRDRLWLFSHVAGSHNDTIFDNGRARGFWNLPANSRITPVEAAFYMDTPNVIMVRYEGRPSLPLQQFAIPFQPLREVVWSIVGAAGASDDRERDAVLELARENPNFSGVMMDDFFAWGGEGKTAVLSVEQLRQLQQRLKSGEKELDLWVVLYAHETQEPVVEHLKHCDVITYWTWTAKELPQLESNFEKAESLAASSNSRIVLGCYMWDYGDKQPMPVPMMRRQCELGLKWLREGRISGMAFLASCICDLKLEAVEWTRKWIQEVGDEPLS